MFVELPESRRIPTRTTGQTTLSVIIHVVLIAAAVRLTAATAASRVPIPRAADLPLFHAAPHPLAAQPAAPAAAAAAPAIAPPVLIAAPAVVSPNLPPVDAGLTADPRRFAIGLTGPPSAGASNESSDADAVLAAADVDQPAEYARGVEPVYPPALRRAGVSGTVIVQYVVDSSGRVEAGSFKVTATDHPSFADAARAAILGALFRPARVRGRAVRQLVEQTVRFELHR